jgi:hypothetical protein
MSSDELQNMLYRMVAEAISRDWPQRPASQIVFDLLKETRPGVANSVSGVARENRGDGATESTASLLARQLADLAAVARTQTETVEANTRAVIENSLVKAAEGKATTAGSVAKTVFSFLGSGLGLVRLLGGLFGGRDSASAEPNLARFVLPAPVQLAAAWTASGLQPLRYGQDGLPQAAPAMRQAPIMIEVHAMDSRSFLDHSAEIAQAVKEALLHSHSLNDVVTEL